MRLKLILGAVFALMLIVGASVQTASAGKKSDDSTLAAKIAPNVNDPGDGGGAYPHWTGYCGVGSPYTPYTYGDIGYFHAPPYYSGDGRDKCYNDGFMYREIFNGSSWNWSGYRYD